MLLWAEGMSREKGSVFLGKESVISFGAVLFGKTADYFLFKKILIYCLLPIEL